MLFIGLLLLVSGAQAAVNYRFSPLDRTLDILPASCSYYSPTAYNCTNKLDLADDDTITIASPLTITFAGIFTTGKRNVINSAGIYALTVATNAIFNLGEDSKLTANVVGTAAVNLEIGSTLTGNLSTTTSTGIVVLKANSSLTGSITTDLGAVTLAEDVKLSGSISTEHGGAITVGSGSQVGGNIYTGIGDAAVTLLLNVVVTGNVTTGAGTITVGNGSSIVGAITCERAGIVTLGHYVTVKSGIHTLAGGVTSGEYANIGSPGINTLAGGVTLWAYSVVTGGISTNEGIVTLWHDVTVNGSITTGAGGISIERLSAICGNVYSSTGILVLTAGIKVGGNVTSGVGTITIGTTGTDISTVGGFVYGAAALTMTKVWVGGNVSAAGAITVTDVRIGGSLTGTVTNNNSTSGDTALVIPASTGCTSTVTSTVAGAFECLEKGLLAAAWIAETTSTNTTHRLYTKLAGTPFVLDVVALKTDGTIESNYVATGGIAKSVTLDLVDGSVAACAALPSLSGVLSQTASFTGVEAILGRATSTFLTVNNAYANLRCRVTDANQTVPVVACSSDSFAVRPSAFVVSQNTPTLNAGSTFTLQATAVKTDLTVATLYTAVPTLNLVQITGVPGFTSTALAPQTLPVAVNGNSSATFTYDEVGSLTLPASASGGYGVSDSSYTQVDGSTDCIASSASNTLDSSGKYGCLIGQSAALTVGRFYPDHFDITSAFAPACPSGSFSYMGQPFTLGYSVTAKSLARISPNAPGNSALKRYSGGQLLFAALNGATDLLSRLSPTVTSPFTPIWTNGSYTQSSAQVSFARPSGVADATWGPFDALNIGVAVDDADGAAYASTVLTFDGLAPTTCLKSGFTACQKYASLTSLTPTHIRLGRLKLSNTYGSERLPLAMPLAIEYWTGNGWAKNSLDTCSVLSSSNFSFVFPPSAKNNLVACNSALTVTGSAPAYTLSLSKPSTGKTGWADLTLNLGATPAGTQCSAVPSPGLPISDLATSPNMPTGMPWLQTNGANPSARATFGVFKSPLIYRRENY